MGTLSGAATYTIFLFCLPSQWGSTLKGKSLLIKKQVLSLMSRNQYGKVKSPLGSNMEDTKTCPPFDDGFVAFSLDHFLILVHQGQQM